MTVVLLAVGVLLALAASALFSGAETGVYCLNRVRLRVASEEGRVDARRLERLMRHPEKLVITTLLGTNVADYVLTACATALLLHVQAWHSVAEVLATLLVTPLILVFGGVIPKDWFRQHSNRLMMRLVWPLLIAMRAAESVGVVWLLRTLTRRLLRWLDPQRAQREGDLLPRTRTLHLLREGAVRGGLTTIQRDLIERVLTISEVRIGQVMVPRARAATVSRDIGREDFLRIARMAHFSRFPVYEGDPRNVVGTVNVYDVFNDEARRDVVTHVRPAVFLKAYESVSMALMELQRRRETMAVVQDRTGQCVGVLTIKDLVEEIVGDLEAW